MIIVFGLLRLLYFVLIVMAFNCIKSDESIRLIIEMVEVRPSIWDNISSEYKDRDKRRSDYDAILQAVKEKVPEAELVDVKAKWTYLRSHFGKELLKTRIKHSGDGVDDVYTSGWSFYNDMKFVVDTITPRASQSNVDRVPGDNDPEDPTPALVTTNKRRKLSHSPRKTDDPVAKALGYLERLTQDEEKEDEASLFCKSLAIEMGQLSPANLHYVKYRIQNIMYEASNCVNLGQASGFTQLNHNTWRQPVVGSMGGSADNYQSGNHGFQYANYSNNSSVQSSPSSPNTMNM